jgi:hypothetical protein
MAVMKAVASLVFAASIACATSPSTPSAGPTVTISQQSVIARNDVPMPGGVPLDYQLTIRNPRADAVTLTSVEIETVGLSGAYSMRRVRHAFALTVQPQATETLLIRAWVQKLQETDSGDVNAPVTVRGVAHFSSAAGSVKSSFAARVQ